MSQPKKQKRVKKVKAWGIYAKHKQDFSNVFFTNRGEAKKHKARLYGEALDIYQHLPKKEIDNIFHNYKIIPVLISPITNKKKK